MPTKRADHARAATSERRLHRLHGEHGWTLMETMVVTSIIAILSAIAIPQWNAVSTQMRTSAAATELLGDVQFARVMSQRTGVPYYINLTGGSGVNYAVQRAQNVGAQIDPGNDQPVRKVNLGTKMPEVVFSQSGVDVDCFGGSVSSATPSDRLVFNARGLPNGARSYFISSQDGENVYAVTVTGAGQARVCHRVGGSWQ